LEKTRQLVSRIDKIQIIKTSSEVESLLLEADFVKKRKPFYNIKLIDDKAYLLIKITIKDEIPKVLISRKEDDKNSIYFGPFTSAASVKIVLRTIRKIFPYQSIRNHAKKKCLYNHLNLCPCPPTFTKHKEKMEYKKNVLKIVKFLKGNTKSVIKELEKERESLSKNYEFEKAGLTQKKIDSIKFVTSPSYSPFEYEENPNLEEDLRMRQLNSLSLELRKKGVLTASLERIECYDISNISGKFATGSMVVLQNGEISKSEYRRFKIKRSKGPNDFAMIEEVIQRRFKNRDWEMPNLLIVDGGKGQISSAVKVLETRNLKIPVIGLAKKEETIFTQDFQKIKLPKNSDALKLVMKIRDEAHRFAISYHKKLRAKAFIG